MQVRRGTASSWTSTNPTLAAGELGFETDTGKFKIGTGSSTWTALLYAGGGQSSLTTYQYTATAGQTTFSGSDINSNTLAYTVGAIQVYLNGALLQNTVDFTASNGTSVVLTGGAGLGDSLTIISFATFDVANTIPVSAFTAKGQILVATGSGAYTAQAVGTNGQLLSANSAQADGVEWVNAPTAGANWTLLNAGGTALTGASTITVSGISGADKIAIFLDNASSASASSVFNIRFNGSSASNYNWYGMGSTYRSTYDNFVFRSFQSQNTSGIEIGEMSGNAGSGLSGYMIITGCNASGNKVYNAQTGVSPSGSTGNQGYGIGGYWNNSAAITSVSIVSGTGNFDDGNIRVYTSA
jgi:hypothetical protein